MEIRQFVQGPNDKELFGLVGHWVTSKDVHTALGGPVTSDTGDMWLVAMDGDTPLGFALAHPLAGGSVHIKQLFAQDKAEQTRAALLKALLPMLTDVSRVYTFARESDTLWAKHGFSWKARARGEFGTYEKESKQ